MIGNKKTNHRGTETQRKQMIAKKEKTFSFCIMEHTSVPLCLCGMFLQLANLASKLLSI